MNTVDLVCLLLLVFMLSTCNSENEVSAIKSITNNLFSFIQIHKDISKTTNTSQKFKVFNSLDKFTEKGKIKKKK